MGLFPFSGILFCIFAKSFGILDSNYDDHIIPFMIILYYVLIMLYHMLIISNHMMVILYRILILSNHMMVISYYVLII